MKRTRGRKWMAIRGAQLKREPLCRMCKTKNIYTPATTVDHIRPIYKGGNDNRDNLQSLCHKCHVIKTNNDMSKPNEVGPDGYPVNDTV